jgi:hypothetical protein
VGEIDEELHRFVGDSILRVIEVQSGSLQCQALTAVRVVGKQLPEMQL